MSDAESWPVVGATIAGRYRLDAALGSDGARAIFEASDRERQGMACALKLTRAGLLDRSKSLQGLDNDHLVKILDAGHDADRDVFFVASELLKGADLDSISKQSGPLPAEQVAAWVRHACRGLEAAHDEGLSHGALSLRSLFLTRRAGVPTVVILNLEEAALFARPSFLPFRAPESTDSKPGVAADVYAIGHIAYALLTGEPFWQRDVPEDDDESSEEPPSVRASHVGVVLDEAFDRWFTVATAFEPKSRYRSVADAAAALELALGIAADARSSLRKITWHLDAVPLGKTLPSDLPDATGNTEPAPASVDPLGDTHAGAGLSDAAKAVRAAVPRPIPRPTHDELERAGIPQQPLGGRIVAVAILVIALVVLVAFLVR